MKSYARECHYSARRSQSPARLTRSLQHLSFRAELLRKRRGYVAEGISGTVRDDELAFLEQLHRPMPIRDAEKCVNADQKVKLVGLLERALEPANRLQREVGLAGFSVQLGLKVGRNEC